MLLLNRWCTILSFASVLAVTGAHPLIRPFRSPSISFSAFYPPPSFYLSSANHVLPFIAWRVSLGLNWLYAFSLVLFVFSEGNRAHEANTLSRQAIHTPSRISAAGRLASSSRRLGNYTLRKQNKIQSLAFAAKSHCRKYKHHCIQSLSSGGVE
ncbi:hypothetical protein IG631_12877 [Alternaria alternata]|nr:hypothetical protein IG631_12877 [Alternaria alternata]